MRLPKLVRDRSHRLCWHESRHGRKCLRPASEHDGLGPHAHPYVAPPPLPAEDDRAARRLARAVTKHMVLNWEMPL
jgi:hypothetical protein